MCAVDFNSNACRAARGTADVTNKTDQAECFLLHSGQAQTTATPGEHGRYNTTTEYAQWQVGEVELELATAKWELFHAVRDDGKQCIYSSQRENHVVEFALPGDINNLVSQLFNTHILLPLHESFRQFKVAQLNLNSGDGV